jgi:AsmA-like C-terminal region
VTNIPDAEARRLRRILIVALGILCLIVVLIAAAAPFLNQRLTNYIEGLRFRAALEQETARGLHFLSSEFASIRRTGLLSAQSESFNARDGRKAMTTLDAERITARFNPLGVFLRRWQIDDLQIERGKIGIQVYEPKPEPPPARPWYFFLLPNRVYLKCVWSDNVDVRWPTRAEEGGIFRTHLLITPHGRDFEYRATSGILKNPQMPELAVRQIHLLITKTLFSLFTLDLNSGEGSIHGEGTTAISGEKHADFSFKWNDVPVREWLPKTWSGDFDGAATGDLHWTGNDYRLAAATMTGAVDVKGGRVGNLKLFDQIATVTNRKDLAQLELDECKARFKWHQGDCELNDIALEQAGKFRIEGMVSFSEHSLGGTLQIGLAPDYLDWLPHPEEVFPRRNGRYLWTTVHLSGTLQSPRQDLSPRLVQALADSPGALLGAAFRALGVWLRSQR